MPSLRFTLAKNKYITKDGFDYEDAMSRTASLVSQANDLLEELEGLLYCENSCNAWGKGMDDIVLLPDLRSLTCVKGIVWPEKVRKYIDTCYQGVLSGLYDDYAC